MGDVSSLKDTIVAKSDQLNGDDLLSGPRTVTVTAVRRSAAPDQPVEIAFQGDNGKPYKPCKSMRKVLIFAWGDDGREWVGRSMTLFTDPEVKFGGIKVGGIRISHLSDIERDIAISLTATKGKKAPVTVKKLVVEKKQAAAVDMDKRRESMGPSDADVKNAEIGLEVAASEGMVALVSEWKATPAAIRAIIGPDGCPQIYKDIAAKADAEPSDVPARTNDDSEEF